MRHRTKSAAGALAIGAVTLATAGLLAYETLHLRPGEQNLNDRLNNLSNQARELSLKDWAYETFLAPEEEMYIPQVERHTGVYREIPYVIEEGETDYEDKRIRLGLRDSTHIEVTKQNTNMYGNILPYDRDSNQISEQHPFSLISNEQYDTLRNGLLEMHRNGETNLDSLTQDLWDRTIPKQY